MSIDVMWMKCIGVKLTGTYGICEASVLHTLSVFHSLLSHSRSADQLVIKIIYHYCGVEIVE